MGGHLVSIHSEVENFVAKVAETFQRHQFGLVVREQRLNFLVSLLEQIFIGVVDGTAWDYINWEQMSREGTIAYLEKMGIFPARW